MYLPPHFAAKDRRSAADIVRAEPLATLISNDDDGVPFVSHLPLHLEEHGDEWLLLGHCAKSNLHWRYLQARPTAVVSFLGPHRYLSPSVYPDLMRVPTWNYVAVYCTVQASLIQDAAAKDALLKKLIGDHDRPYIQQWLELGAEYRHRMLAGIVGFELRVTKLECKLKLNQHRPEAFAGMRSAYLQGGDDGRALLQWMDKLGMGASEPADAP